MTQLPLLSPKFSNLVLKFFFKVLISSFFSSVHALSLLNLPFKEVNKSHVDPSIKWERLKLLDNHKSRDTQFHKMPKWLTVNGRHFLHTTFDMDSLFFVHRSQSTTLTCCEIGYVNWDPTFNQILTTSSTKFIKMGFLVRTCGRNANRSCNPFSWSILRTRLPVTWS